MSLNFLEVCLSPDLGGLELCVIDYFHFFKSKTSCKIVVSSGSKLEKSLENEDKFLLKRGKLFSFFQALKLARYIDANAIDVIHFHWTKDIKIVVLAKLLSKTKPKLVQSRHMNMTRFKDDFYHKYLYKNIDVIHAVTQQVKEQLKRFIPQDIRPKLKMIYLGVKEPKLDIKKIQNLKDKYKIKDEFVVGIIGRIEEAKGQYLLIEALPRLKNLNIKVLIVGHTMDEAYLAKLKKIVNDLSLGNRVVFTGFTKDINEHIKLFDISVLATKKETFGLVVIESMINKVPVIATNKGGPLEIIQENESGVFFDRTVDDLAKKIKLLYEDKEFLDRLSDNGYERVKKVFNKDIQIQKMYKALNEG